MPVFTMKSRTRRAGEIPRSMISGPLNGTPATTIGGQTVVTVPLRRLYPITRANSLGGSALEPPSPMSACVKSPEFRTKVLSRNASSGMFTIRPHDAERISSVVVPGPRSTKICRVSASGDGATRACSQKKWDSGVADVRFSHRTVPRLT